MKPLNPCHSERSEESKLLLPLPKRPWTGQFGIFLVIAVFTHVLGYFWLLKYGSHLIRKPDELIKVTLLREPPPPAVKPKLTPPPPPAPVKLKPVIAPQTHHPSPAAPAKLHLQETKFHEKPSKAPPSTAPPNLQSVEESKGGKTVGSPNGVEGGTGSPESTGKTPLPTAPPKLIVPDRKNPAVLSRCEPAYPEIERDQGIEGSVRLSVLVGRQGQIVEIRVDQSSGNADLDQSAIQSVRQCWRFAPAIQNNQPVETWATFAINFQLQ